MRKIRKYRQEDKVQLVIILRLLTPKYFHPAEEPDYLAYLEQYFSNYYVVVDQDKVVAAGGFNLGFQGGRTARISWDLTHPQWQGKGLGKSLVLYRIRELQKNPAITEIEVRTSQLVYLFYEKMGFCLQKVEKNFWAPGFDLYQMNLKLS